MATSIAVTFVAFLHLLFMILEMFFWTRPLGRRIFGLKREQAEQTAVLAANQGLYNGFLAAGLIWGLASPVNSTAINMFFLVCVIVAGVFGAITANRSILFIQALPGATALAIMLTSG
jgi:putative membrane protein